MDKADKQPTIAQDLLPCPFCGGEAEIVEIEGGIGALFYASCKDDDCCGYHIDPWVKYARRIEAATAWNARTTSLAAQDGLVAEIERQEGLVKTYRGAQLRAEEKLCREQANAQGWKRRAEILESKLAALSAIKEQHHD